MRKGRKKSGGKYIKSRKKKKFEQGISKPSVRLGETKRKKIRVKGGNKKTFLLTGKSINIRMKDEIKKAEIKNILETPSNRFLARQNIITKGAILETEMGKARVTNRPSKEGVINGILIE